METGAIAGITDFETLRRALDLRKRSLRMTNLELDHIAKLQSGYTGKIMCGIKRPGDMSLPALLGALNAELALIPSRAENKQEHQEIVREAREAMKKLMADRGRKGGKKTNGRMTKEERSKKAKKMINARWRKWREKKRAEAEAAISKSKAVRHARKDAEAEVVA